MDDETRSTLGRTANAYWLSLGVLLTVGILVVVLSILNLVALYGLRAAVKTDVHDTIWDYFNQYGLTATQ